MNLVASIKHLLFPYADCEMAAYQLCKKLNVPVTKTKLQQLLMEHPAYPSLLSISDVLRDCGVENLALRAELEQFADFPVPLICQISLMNREKKRGTYFSVVTNYDRDEEVVTFFHPLQLREVNVSARDFRKKFNSITLLAENNGRSGERDYLLNRRKEKIAAFSKILSALIIPVLAVVCCVAVLAGSATHSIFPVIFTSLVLIGTIMGSLLLWYEVDQYNPAIKQLCSAGTKTNCKAVLESPAAKILGVSWSAIGFVYFAGNLFALLVSGVLNQNILFALSWLNGLTLPYIPFSLYYQAKVTRQWCTMCVCIQIILAAICITAVAGSFYSISSFSNMAVSEIFMLLTVFAIPTSAVAVIMFAFQKAKERKRSSMELARIKHNPQIFEALLAKQKVLSNSPDGLGIILGNPDARNTLIKVCNPYCGPCAKAHPLIDELLDCIPDLKVQIILMATNDERDSRNAPVRHLLAISSKGNQMEIKKALDDWYLADTKDYEVFSRKYPLNGELKEQNDKITAMETWCELERIAVTPTFFINNCQLPDIYSANDLKYFLSV